MSAQKISKIVDLVTACTKLEISGHFNNFLELINLIVDHNDPVQLSMLKSLIDSQKNSDSINQWFFNIPSDYYQLIMWLGRVKAKNEVGEKYVWSIGVLSKVNQKIKQILNPNFPKLGLIPFLLSANEPPYLVFFQPDISSSWQIITKPSAVTVDNIDIFQLDYDGQEPKKDIDQLMIINCSFIEIQSQKLLKRVQDFGSEGLIKYCSQNLFERMLLLNSLHMELHNRGHFVGPWPFDSCKSMPVYECVEEYRACLLAGSLGQVLIDDQELSLALCVTIVLNRLLIYGFESYLLEDEEKTFADIREITVSSLFYQELSMLGVLKIVDGRLDLGVELIGQAFNILSYRIQDKEKAICNQSNDNEQKRSLLIEEGIRMLQVAYPDKKLPKGFEEFYQMMQTAFTF